MAFVLELATKSQQKYIQNYISAILREYNIKAEIMRSVDKLSFACESSHPKLQEAVDTIADTLPASLFLKGSSSSRIDQEPEHLPKIENDVPLSLGLCPSCQKEMLDVTSRRYYYPFTSCLSCGGNHSFLRAYPYERAKTSFKFVVPCEACQKEMHSVGKKEQHHINSCHECGIPVRLVSKSSERYANDAGSFRTMFEVAAKAVADNKKLLMKTTMGYRLFYKASQMHNDSLLMMIKASNITDHLALITEEFHALLSIERPVMHVTLSNEKLKEVTGANTAFVKYPDDGFSILLGVELQKLGIDFIAYEEVDEGCDADILMDYDLEIEPQSDMRFFLNKDVDFIAGGERVSFPSHNLEEKNILSVADELVGIPKENKMFFDKMEYFEKVEVLGANVLMGDSEKYHENQKYFVEDEATFMAAIVENQIVGKKAIGAYFDEVPSFLYYDGKKIIRAVPPKSFEGENLLERISQLREGSDRLVENLQKTLPDLYKEIKALEGKKDIKLFEVVALILGLDDRSMRGVVKEAMKFVGKGGIQVDMHVKDNRFDNTAFLASLISYMLAGVSTSILAYSIFESFGDYFYEIIQELQSKTKATEIVLCGSDFANQSLFSRMQRNLKLHPPHMSINYPIGKESAVVGGVYL